ncbi:DNA polymerase III subunit epsilon [Tetrabaena socialis]|uniref:DNA polymerase III subunit epsilon n=1 Tax=Tetrabaena socialis TaxID=47790 RepID=A0A2J8A1T0_9CHLO|nr:DNA polymerase III subunit epsilon [Tetrabaena socialis]|eukprot:PNH06458.1 DNA polymerase III subunit epsilon [Tetrabaena socialis]
MDVFASIDTETTGLDPETSRVIQIGVVIGRVTGTSWNLLDEYSVLIQPDDFVIPDSKHHHVTHADAMKRGVPLAIAFAALDALIALHKVTRMAAYNAAFDKEMLAAEARRYDFQTSDFQFLDLPWDCIMKKVASGGRWSKLTKVHSLMFPGRKAFRAHDALEDARAAMDVLAALSDPAKVSLLYCNHPTKKKGTCRNQAGSCPHHKTSKAPHAIVGLALVLTVFCYRISK